MLSENETSCNSHRVAIGVVRKTIGFEGACAITPFGATLKGITLPADLLIGSCESDCRKITVDRVEFRAKGPVCFFRGITVLESAKELIGLFLFIDSELLPDLEEGNYYQYELMGMKVMSDLGFEIGTVIAVHNFPTIDSIEVRRLRGDAVMLPLSAQALKEIDRVKGSLTVRHLFIEELL